MTSPSAPTPLFERSHRTNISRRSLSAHEKVRRAVAAVRLRTRAALLVVGVAALVAQQAGGAAPLIVDPLPFRGGYLITGDYVVGNVVLSAPSGGFSTGTISISGVPANADILAAFVYGEAISTHAGAETGAPWIDRDYDPQLEFGEAGETQPVPFGTATSQALTGGLAACSAPPVGEIHKITWFRGDVLRFLPLQVDVNGTPTGKRLINASDLTAANFGQLTVKVPEGTTGATAVVVYRDPTLPLRKIVLYDGVHVQPPASSPAEIATTSQTLRGFYQSDPLLSAAKITHILGKNPNPNGVLTFNGANLAGVPDAASGRAFGSATSDVTLTAPVPTEAQYGEVATTTFTHSVAGAYDCPALGAVIFRANVKDVDADGLPDGIEAGLASKDANGEDLPNLGAMGANVAWKDLFVEISALKTEITAEKPQVQYGKENVAPYSASLHEVFDTIGHNHMPTPDVLKMLGDAYLNGPLQIRAHFDVGPINAYRSLGFEYTSSVADAYLVMDDTHARGGEISVETACTPDPEADQNTPPRWLCQFEHFPGTVMWKEGFYSHREGFVRANGTEFSSTAEQEAICSADPTQCRRRFDRNRKDLFRDLLFAHATGIPKSSFPCVSGNNNLFEWDEDEPLVCPQGTNPNPEFYVPKSFSGKGDLPGGDAMVTLGLWDRTKFVASKFFQASTAMHELGHTIDLRHGGAPTTYHDGWCYHDSQVRAELQAELPERDELLVPVAGTETRRGSSAPFDIWITPTTTF